MQKLILLIALSFFQIAWAADNPVPVQNTDEVSAEDAIEQTENIQSSDSELVPAAELILADIEKTNEVEEETSDRFIPTEQISQDLGVSFPVDI